VRKDRNRKKWDVPGTVRCILLVLLVAQCLRVAFASPRLRMKEVTVTGTRRFTPDQVRRLGQIPLERNIFAVNLVQVSDRLLANPVVQEAVATRVLPDRLHVDIRERVPALQITLTPEKTESNRSDEPTHQPEDTDDRDPDSGEPMILHADREGVVFQKSGAVTDGLAHLEIPAADLPALGQKLRADHVRTVHECVRLAKKEGLRLRRMRVDGVGELWLNIATYPTSPTQTALTVRVGRSTELPEKFRDIHQALLGWPDLPARAAYLNVMCAGYPARMNAPDQQ
jgi:POTRA domain-containing FtsQ-type protein